MKSEVKETVHSDVLWLGTTFWWDNIKLNLYYNKCNYKHTLQKQFALTKKPVLFSPWCLRHVRPEFVITEKMIIFLVSLYFDHYSVLLINGVFQDSICCMYIKVDQLSDMNSIHCRSKQFHIHEKDLFVEIFSIPFLFLMWYFELLYTTSSPTFCDFMFTLSLVNLLISWTRQ